MEKALGVVVLIPVFFVSSKWMHALIKMYLIGSGASMTTSTYSALMNLGVSLFGIVLAIIVLRHYFKTQVLDLKQHFGKVILAGVCGVGLLLFAAYVSAVIEGMFGATGTSANQDSINSVMSTSAYYIMAFDTMILGPINEEIIFRGVLFTMFREKSPFLAYVFGGVFFGLIHVLSYVLAGMTSQLIYGIGYVILGLCLCAIYEESNNIFSTMITHIIYNSIITLNVIMIMF